MTYLSLSNLFSARISNRSKLNLIGKSVWNLFFSQQAQKMATDGGGGDWDRRNRLKVYRGLQRLLERDIKGSAALLIDCIATFSCNEICSYQNFIVYAIMSNLLHLPRPQIKAKILDGPEILSVANDIPVVVSLLRVLATLFRMAREPFYCVYTCENHSYLKVKICITCCLTTNQFCNLRSN